MTKVLKFIIYAPRQHSAALFFSRQSRRCSDAVVPYEHCTALKDETYATNHAAVGGAGGRGGSDKSSAATGQLYPSGKNKTYYTLHLTILRPAH